MKDRQTSRKQKLTKRTVDATVAGTRRYAVLDTEIPGFRLYVMPSGRKAFYLRYRVGGGRGATIREPKIGEVGAITVEAARKMASDWMVEVRAGGDPGAVRVAKRVAPRMGELFDRYLSDHARRKKKVSSVEHDEISIRLYLRPELGKMKVADVKRADISALHTRHSAKPYMANRMISLLSKAFNLAEVWGWRPDGSNPCRHVEKFAEAKRKRFLSAQELALLGETLRRAEAGEVGAVSPQAIAAIRLLILTGMRKNEVLGLRWDWIDLQAGRVNLPDSKTGEKAVPLGPAARELIASIPRVRGNPHLLVGGKPGASLVNLKKPWDLVRKAAGLDDVRIHDLRHSFASVGAASGVSFIVIGALLGQSQAATTLRYAHLSDDPLQEAAGGISDKIAAAMAGADAQVIELSKRSK